MWERLQIRYVKLHFHLKILEDTWLPRQKASALRGGMGQMLLRANCVRDMNCENCDFETECIVRRTMYSRLEIQPAFMSRGDSVGYVIECEDYQEEFSVGDGLDFQLLLLGKNIAYFHQYMQAFASLGMEGLGKHRARFAIESVTNTDRKVLVEGNNIYKENYKIRTVEEYVRYRMGRGRNEQTLVFHTPLAVKHRGSMIDAFDMEAILLAAARRVYIMDCFEGIAAEQADITGHVPGIVSQKVHRAGITRYSSTHDEKIGLKGIRGIARLEPLDEEARILLYAGELLHIGKYTSFGFGRYSLAPERKGGTERE